MAINLTLNNWGIGAWAAYLVVAVAMGIAGHRFGLPMTFRSCLYPIFGHYTWYVVVLTTLHNLCL